MAIVEHSTLAHRHTDRHAQYKTSDGTEVFVRVRERVCCQVYGHA